MAQKNRFNAIPKTCVDSAAFAGAYVPLSTGIPQPCSILRIINSSGVDIILSYDGGVTDQDFVIAGKELTLNMQSNALPETGRGAFPKGFTVHVKGAASQGLVCMTGYYQE